MFAGDHSDTSEDAGQTSKSHSHLPERNRDQVRRCADARLARGRGRLEEKRHRIEDKPKPSGGQCSRSNRSGGTSETIRLLLAHSGAFGPPATEPEAIF